MTAEQMVAAIRALHECTKKEKRLAAGEKGDGTDEVEPGAARSPQDESAVAEG